MRKFFLLFLLLAAGQNLLAHPGHGPHDLNTIWHYVLLPEHGLLPLTLLIAAVWYFRRHRQRVLRRT